MSIDYKLSFLEERDACVLKIEGNLDFDERATFLEAMEKLFQLPGKKLVVDISNISRFSSVYIGTLIDQGGRARADGRILSAAMLEKMARVCRASGMEQVVHIIVVKE